VASFREPNLPHAAKNRKTGKELKIKKKRFAQNVYDIPIVVLSPEKGRELVEGVKRFIKRSG